MKKFGSLEAGGTKFVCAVGNGPDNFVKEIFPTKSPEETINKAIEFFKFHNRDCSLKAIGIGTFGPINLAKESETFGCLTTTPKVNWENTNMFTPFKNAFEIPVSIDTDVNTAALGEYTWGSAKDLNNFIYLTIGTGIGGGGIINGSFLQGDQYPEMGHIFLPKIKGDNFEGSCPYHDDMCFEGLASGTSIGLRCGLNASEIIESAQVWERVAEYISLALVNYIYISAPQKILIGGGVMKQTHLFAKIRNNVLKHLNGYNHSSINQKNISDYICPPDLGENSAILGGFALAKKAYSTNGSSN